MYIHSSCYFGVLYCGDGVCSCISWNMYHKEKLASSDYDGMVTVWDAFSGEKAIVFQVLESVGCRFP